MFRKYNFFNYTVALLYLLVCIGIGLEWILHRHPPDSLPNLFQDIVPAQSSISFIV